MRLLLAALFLPLALTPLAPAETIDDFVLTGPDLSVTFSTPSTFSFPELPHLVTLPGSPSVLATVNGVPGYTLQTTIFSGIVPGPNFALAGPDFASLTLYGATIVTPGPETGTPGSLILSAIFLPGTYAEFASTPASPAPTGYTLTITPETGSPTAISPEPATLSLFATGSLGLLGLIRKRLRR